LVIKKNSSQIGGLKTFQEQFKVLFELLKMTISIILKTAPEMLLVYQFGWIFFVFPWWHPEGGHSVIFDVGGL